MADGEMQLSAEIRTLARQHAAYKIQVAEEHDRVEKLLQLLEEKEQTLENLRSDLDDQTESRRRWQKRAVDIESRIRSVQHILVLIDGNQQFFKHNLIRAATAGAREAVGTLLADVRDFAKDQHKNDLPENTSVVVHIFSDVGRLAHDLSAANLLPDPDQLWTFIQDVSKIEPYCTISDCGAGHEAVDAKMKQFYELYIENCHCRHIFLALGHESEYYNVLQLYSDDDYTMAKTSLVQPIQGFPPGVTIPFNTVNLSALGNVPREESFGGSMQRINGEVSGRQQEDGPERPAMVSNVSEVKSVPNITPTTAVHHPNSLPSTSIAKSTKPLQHDPPPSPSPVQLVDTGPAPEERNGVAHGTNGVQQAGSAGVLKLESSSHSSSNSKTAEQSWETTTGHSYVPPPIQGAWGDEGAGTNGTADNGESSDQKETWTSHPTRPYHGSNNNRPQQPNWRQERPLSGAYNPPARRGRRIPQHFEGSWDDMIQHEDPSQRHPSTHAGSPTRASASAASPGTAPKPKPKLNGLSPSAFERQVVTMPEPNPNERPIRAPIALNQYDQRIDLKLPRPSPADDEHFQLRSRNRKLCNEQHLRHNCHNPQCPYDHEPISDGVFLVLRHKARTLACSVGPNCRRHDCFGGHHCPNVSNSTSCGRPNCPFQARMHDTTDLVIVRTIDPPGRESS